MDKNKMAEVANILGVEIGKPFKIKYGDSLVYGHFELGLYGLEYFKDGDGFYDNDILVALLCGRAQILNLPWLLVKGDQYYSYNDDWKVVQLTWANGMFDNLALYNGIVFKTKEDAEKERPNIYQKLTGKDWEVNGNG